MFQYSVEQFNNVVGNSNWMPWVDKGKGEICLFQFGSSPGYAEKEIRLSRTFEWKLFMNKIERDTSNCVLSEK